MSTPTPLHLSDSLSLPLDAVTQKFAILGRTGSGKTYGATKLAEQMLDHGAQIIVLDPVGVWYGLRSGGHYSIPIFGGLHGDLPLEPDAGAFLANLAVDRGISAVLDVSQFESDAQKARFAEQFAARFFFRKKSAPSPVQLFLEEAQEFVPQNPQGGEQNMLHHFHRIAKLGRNFGIGVTLITQRPQEVSKKALNQTECLLAFQMTGPQERKTIQGWISDKGSTDDIAAILPRLAVGTCRVWSPQWLNVAATITIAKKKTADVSSTPTAGKAAPRAITALSSEDLDALGKEMAATIERAKENDPRELKKQIATLRKQVADLEKRPAEAERVEVPMLTPEQNAMLIRIDEALASLDFAGIKDSLGIIRKRIVDPTLPPVAEMRGILTRGTIPNGHTPVPAPAPSPKPPAPPRLRASAVPADLAITKTQQRILDALAWYHSIGISSPSGLQVGAIALIDSTGGHFSNTVGPLITGGFIARGNGTFTLTAAGHAAANVPDSIATLDDYHAMLRERVRRTKNGSNRTVEMLDSILRNNGNPITTERIGAEVHIDHTGGHFSNTLGPLSTLGFITRRNGVVTPTEILFPPGLS